MAKPSSRQDQVLAALRTRGSARVAELADEFGVSHVTMRRDVEALARDERVVRSHGLVRLQSASHKLAAASCTGTVVMVAPGRSSYFAKRSGCGNSRTPASRCGLRPPTSRTSRTTSPRSKCCSPAGAHPGSPLTPWRDCPGSARFCTAPAPCRPSGKPSCPVRREAARKRICPGGYLTARPAQPAG
ncbi:DeoR family transcriptional regulator [Streptomyces sp. NPDC001508]|uniref:DeoR family transcriptional regulator n=1 Tax=Streptomyces sp. NPDC001508 TaxID=3154656 RepID=UPI00331FC424